MRRRTFLAAIVMACGSRPHRTSRRPGTDDAAVPAEPSVAEPVILQGHTGPSPLMIHGDVAVLRTQHALQFWHATTMRHLGDVAGDYLVACFTEDGSVAALIRRADAQVEVHRIDAHRSVETLTGPLLHVDEGTGLLATGDPSTLYMVTDHDVTKLVLHPGAFDVIATASRPPHSPDIAPVAALSDGRLAMSFFNVIHLVDLQHATIDYSIPGQFPTHLAGTSDGRLWYAYSTADPTRLRTTASSVVVLATLGRTLVASARIDVTPSRVLHMASGGGALALLLATAGDRGETRYAACVVEASGMQRWRAEVPAELAAGLDGGCVAISEQQVVVARTDVPVLAWDAQTGAAILPPA